VDEGIDLPLGAELPPDVLWQEGVAAVGEVAEMNGIQQ
jgi:hypothetical protein